MQILIIDGHPLADSRIQRHIKFTCGQGYRLFRVNVNRTLPNRESDLISETGIPCYVLGGNQLKKGLLNKITYNMNLMFYPNKDIISILARLGISPRMQTIVHVHDPALLPLAIRVSSNFQQVKIVYDRHEVYESPYKYLSLPLPKAGRLFEIMISRRIDGVVTVLEEYRTVVKKMFPRSEVAVVPNYPLFDDYDNDIITSKIKNTTSETILHFVYIGSLSQKYDRDIELIIFIADSLLSNQFNVKFTIGGSTSDEHLLSEFSRLSATYPNKFTYAGYLSHDEAIQFTQDAHFGFLLIKPNTQYWVMTSPNKIFEYLRCGAIPIVRAWCPCRDQIRDSSIWFERDDSNEFILHRIKSLVEDTNGLCTMMCKAYNSSMTYDFKTASQEYISLYDKIWSLRRFNHSRSRRP